MRHRQAEAGHDRVADELVEHAAFAAMHSTIRLKYSLRNETVPCAPYSSVIGVKPRMSVNITVASVETPPSMSGALAVEQLAAMTGSM